MMKRRQLLQAGLAMGISFGSRLGTAETQPLVVMTNYPQEMISRYVDAFGQANPDIRVDIVWHSGEDARDYLQGPGHGKVDVYWAPSIKTFAELNAQHAFQKLNIDRTGLPGKLGRQQISDPNGYCEATEVAGYGILYNPAYLQQHALPTPAEWTDLAKPVYAGHITMPVPSKVGFAPAITEIILQAYGWDKGWRLMAQIAGNATLQAGRGDDAIGAITRGDKGIDLAIDFLAAQAITRGAAVGFVYPKANAFEPANIAIPVDAPNPAAALQYVRFVLSDAGQKLLVDPDLRRLAIRPSAYAHAPKGYYNPWKSEVAQSLSFDSAVFARRRDIDNAVFDRLIYEPRDRLTPLWATIHRLQAKAAPAAATALIGQAIDKMATPPVTESQADELAAVFSQKRRSDTAAATPDAAWTTAISGRIDEAQALLTRAESLVQPA